MDEAQRNLLSYVIFNLLINKLESIYLGYPKLRKRMEPYWRLFNCEHKNKVDFIEYINWLAYTLEDLGYVLISIESNSIWFRLTEEGKTIDYPGRPTMDTVLAYKKAHKSR